MKRRSAALFLAFLMIAGSLSGCRKTGNLMNSGTDGPAGSGTASGKTKLTALYISHPLTKSIDDMKWVQELEEQCNVTVEWEQIYTDWETVKSTRFASGSIPDLLFNATVDSDYATYHGLFQDLTDLIEADAPNIQSMFQEEPDTKVLAAAMDGQIFGIPKFQGKWPSTNTVMFINKEWLSKLGLRKPTTFSELKTVLEAFKNEDPNGNGKADEIPLDYNAYGGNNAWFNSAYSLTNLLGGLGIQLTDWGLDSYFAEDGVVKSYAVDDRYKLFMKYLADLYSEGLINPNAITNDYSAYQSLSRGNEQKDALVGVVFGWEETDKFGASLYTQYEPLAPLAYDIGCDAKTYDTRWRNDYTGLNISSNRVCMSAKCKNKDAAMKFIDAFYDKTAGVESLFGGISDGCIEKTGEDSYKILPPSDPDTDAGTWKWTNTFADNGPMYIRRDIQIEMAQDMTNALKERDVYHDFLAKADQSDTYPQMFMKYTPDDLNTMAVAQANINNIIDNYWSLWLTGESDIDADWDSYVERVHAAGLTDVLKIRQAAFDAYLSK
ncbi:extracellular solute-binding protein [Clostridium sp. Marseille-P2415]|uniref:extracellular solute-binding protein n=1 Tax=Clostridium sp. Marseille-P2415 TaxID=1805471 RepID=UPI0009883A45|nr:extracellular solute-binding protein [Clostridium sp. Marseille-P2415]